MAQEDSQAGQQVSDNIVSEFGTYQEFLDSQITRKDLFYLEVREYLSDAHALLCNIKTDKYGVILDDNPVLEINIVKASAACIESRPLVFLCRETLTLLR